MIKKNVQLSEQTAGNLIKQIISGYNEMSKLNPDQPARDITIFNILLDKNFTIKIDDFGF